MIFEIFFASLCYFILCIGAIVYFCYDKINDCVEDVETSIDKSE